MSLDQSLYDFLGVDDSKLLVEPSPVIDEALL